MLKSGHGKCPSLATLTCSSALQAVFLLPTELCSTRTGCTSSAFPVCPGSALTKWERKLKSHSRTYLRWSHATGNPAGRGGSSSSRCESGASRGPSPQCAPPARSTAHAAASPERRRPGGDCARALCLPGAGGGGGASCVTPGARAGLGWGGAASNTRALRAPAPRRIR